MAECELAADEVTVRMATAADAAATSRLTQRAFSATTVQERAQTSGTSSAAPPPPSLTVVAEHGGQVVAVASADLRGQWFGGRRTLCAAVSGVAVGVEARGLGVGRVLMKSLLNAAHQAGATTSALIPSTHRFYASLGYGIGGRRPVFALATAEVRTLSNERQPGLRLRRARSDDAAAVAGLVRQRAARGSGLLDHSGADERTAEDPAGAEAYVAEVDGVVHGWCALSRREPSSRYANYDLAVLDLVSDSPDVERVLWRLLVADHPSALRAEAVVLPGSLVEHHLDRQQEVVDDASWMLRLLDVDAALTARGYPPPVRAELVLRVTDSICPWNEGTRVLSVSDGSAQVRPAPQASSDAVVSAADLASLFAAHLDPMEARHQGRLVVGEDRTAGILRALFAGPPAWLARAF